MKLILTESEQLELIETGLHFIKHIHNPTRAVILKAIKIDGEVLQYVEKQDEELHYLAVSRSSRCLKYCVNPSRRIILLALKKYGETIEYVQEQDDELIRLALADSSWSIKYVKNQLYEYQMLAVNNRPDCINVIDNPHIDALIIGLYHNKLYFKGKYEDALGPYGCIFAGEEDRSSLYADSDGSDYSDNEMVNFSDKRPSYDPKYYNYYVKAISLLDSFHEEVLCLPGALQILKNSETKISLLFTDHDIRFGYTFI